MLLERRVEGMIFISSEVTDLRSDHAHYRRLLREGARLVFVNGGSAQLDVTSVGVDERAAGRLATEHLLALGHTRIGFAAGDALSSPTREKAEGRESALRAAGVEPDGLVVHASFTVEGGREAFRGLVGAAGRASDGDHLLERPDGDRRDPRGRGARRRRAGRPLGRSASTGSTRPRGTSRR